MSDSGESCQFRYHSENPLSGALIGGLPLLLALAAQNPILRLVGVAFGVGPLAWLLIQVLRRWRSLRVTDEALVVRFTYSGRVVRIPWSNIRGVAVTERGGLAVAYEVPPPQPPAATSAGTPTGQRSLFGPYAEDTNDIHAKYIARPKQRLLHTAKIDHILDLVALIDERRGLFSHLDVIPPEHVRRLAARRRIRDVCIALLALLSTPVYVILLVRLFGNLR